MQRGRLLFLPAGKPLSINERGIILPPPIHISNGLFQMDTRVDFQEIRFTLVFWDKIDILNSYGIDADVEYLIQEGVVQRSEADVLIGNDICSPTTPSLIIATFEGSLEQLNLRDPWQWSLARGERSLSVIDRREDSVESLVFKLHAAVPVPSEDVPFSDILTFRDKRKSELLNFRFHLENTVQEILKSPVREFAELTAIASFQKAIRDYVKVAKEERFKLRLSDLKAKIDLSSFVAGAVAFDSSSKFGLPIVAQLLWGIGVGAAASVYKEVGRSKPTGAPTPYEYISKYHNELWVP